MKKYLIYPLCFFLFSCSLLETEEKDFYNSIAGWDIIHVPIFPPYRATSTYPDDWGLTGNPHSVGSISLLKFGVTGQTIYGATRYMYTDSVKNWFLLDHPSGLYAEYKTEKELDQLLAYYDLEKNEIKTCQEYFDQLSEGKRCYWYPEKGKVYPKSSLKEKAKPNTIEIKTKDEKVSFNLEDKLKANELNIHHFKLKYNDPENKLYHISFENGSPILIQNDTIISVFHKNSQTIRVSVYIPYPVAKENGIDEKNRPVETKTFWVKE